MKNIWKGLLMALFTTLASAFAVGLPQDAPHWYILCLTLLGTILGYFAQSALFPSTSGLAEFNFRDLLKGLLVALSNMLSTIGADMIVGQTLNWPQILNSMVSVCVLYFVKQFATQKPTITAPAK